jgi:hypothetical protein
MGTNFYVAGSHIGKRSAAGWWCWDCGITLCKGGPGMVHYDAEWHKACPQCGKKPTDEGWSDGAAGRELGFNHKPFAKKAGVASCSSFTWAMNPGTLRTGYARKRIKDEYGSLISRKDFAAMLEECPIQTYDMVGHEFS